MKAERRRLVGILAVVLLAPVAVVTVAIGGTDGSPRDQLWEQCQQYPYPQGLAPHPEAINAGGERTLFPLGLICTYDNPNTATAPVSIAHPQWDATVVASLATLGVLTGVAITVAARRPSTGERAR